MDMEQRVPASYLQAGMPRAGITANFLLIASLISVVAVTALVCAVAAAVLVVLR